MTDSITNLPDEFKTAIEIVSLCTSIPIYLVLSIKRVLLSGEVEPNTQNLLQKGRPFILRRLDARGKNRQRDRAGCTTSHYTIRNICRCDADRTLIRDVTG